jgi:AraC-like DNA-binding protein
VFVPFRIDSQIDSDRRYRLNFSSDYPFAVRCFEFLSASGAVPMTWHERFELFCPVSGSGQFRMGAHLHPFTAGDILLVDNLVLHGVESYRGTSRCAVVLSFAPEFVAGPGALPCDAYLLQPFLRRRSNALQLSADRAESPRAWQVVCSIVRDFTGDSGPHGQAILKHRLIELLILLGKVWRSEVATDSDYDARRDRLRRLAPLLESLRERLSRRLTVREAAEKVHMSESYFMRFFRTTTGMSFLAYLNQLRVTRAFELLMHTDLPIAHIAAETGFCDQSHLIRHFRERFGAPPGRLRRAHGSCSE